MKYKVEKYKHNYFSLTRSDSTKKRAKIFSCQYFHSKTDFPEFLARNVKKKTFCEEKSPRAKRFFLHTFLTLSQKKSSLNRLLFHLRNVKN